jgi:heptaprenylglyceryl phosphate synthase
MSVFNTKFTPSPITFGNSSSSKPTTKSSFDWGGLGTAVLTAGGGIYASEQQRKAAQAQADALIAQGMSQIEVQKLILEGKRLDLEALKSGAGTKSGSKTLYIALAVGGVVILGAVIFAVTRKK